MISSVIALWGLQAGCLADQPPADCPQPSCVKGDTRQACQLQGAVKRQIKATWTASDGLNQHGAMVKNAPKRAKPQSLPVRSRVWHQRRIVRCGAGVSAAALGVWLAFDNNWLSRGAGVIAAGAGLWVCVLAR